jgi:23S rRNA U2552 (ribose-2'-O)-methylase RlmE/FtsJ
MLHFQIPRTSGQLLRSIQCQPINDPKPKISNSLSHYLYDIKQRIDAHENQWDVCKRYTNPFEYIHTIVPGKRKGVAKHRPLSRSYFKMIELVKFFKLLETQGGDIRSFHLAEGPGGFIEALAHIRGNENDRYIGMTMLDAASLREDQGVPGWKKSQQFLAENATTVSIECGADGTGNILSMENLRHCIAKYGNQMDLITGDGGFDFSQNFNEQEIHITKLLFGQLVYAVCLQKPGGCFVLKVFDCFMSQTLDILAILSSLYDKVYLTKPQTSRYGNSEKYVVCKGFIPPSSSSSLLLLIQAFSDMLDCKEEEAFRFLSRELPLLFLSRMEEYNAIFGQQQIENIYYTLSLMEHKYKSEKMETLVKSNVQKCMQWCAKFNVSC